MFSNRTLLTPATTVGAVILLIAIGGWPIVPGTSAFATSESTTVVADKPAVLIIVKEQSADMNKMILREVKPIIKAITDAGYSVVVASESGTNIRAWNNVQLNVDKRLSEVRVEDYVGIVVPCMAAGGLAGSIPPEAIEIIRTANKLGMPIAAQQSGVQILWKAGALKDRAYATGDPIADPNMGGDYSGMGVVRDGNIVTSGTCPYMAAWIPGLHDGTEVLVRVFLSMLPTNARVASQ